MFKQDGGGSFISQQCWALSCPFWGSSSSQPQRVNQNHRPPNRLCRRIDLHHRNRLRHLLPFRIPRKRLGIRENSHPLPHRPRPPYLIRIHRIQDRLPHHAALHLEIPSSRGVQPCHHLRLGCGERHGLLLISPLPECPWLHAPEHLSDLHCLRRRSSGGEYSRQQTVNKSPDKADHAGLLGIVRSVRGGIRTGE